ncbi:MAG: 4-(cytidine 5'-diphospho)-2-C-methyl-D-erythritol kinase [Treponema sp.]
MKTIVMHPHAKINLHLEVGKKRVDGFHDINSLMQEISISDVLTVSLSKTETCINIAGAKIEEDNSLKKACLAFRKVTGINFAINVSLIKQIPLGAGLGGASSDAASLILALNKLLNTNLSYEELLQIALEVGSDVPFFLTGGTAKVEGRGEKVFPCKINTSYVGILIYPEFPSFTKEAYAMLDSEKEKITETLNLDKVSLFNSKFFNSFEKPLFERYPVLKEIKNDFLTSMSDATLMSGAGSSIYGLFRSWEKANAVWHLFSEKWSNCNFFVPIEK